ncbi:MAG: hypothetical protein HZC36_12605 [Armatimonadetes bacterium]|nr:hypothetical protein [Armatimonadota bacterium]
MQWHDTGWFPLVFVLLLATFVILNIARAKGAKELFLRRIPGLNAIDEAIGRATEMGKPVLMVPGIGDVETVGVQAQALTIFGYISRTVAKFASPMRLCVAQPATYTLAQEIIRDSYQAEGVLDRFDPDSVQFLTDQQFPFAAGVAGIIHRDRTAACFLMGPFYAESLIFAETANSVGAIQIAGSTQNTQTPFFIAACDYVLIGDEFYAASAYLSRQPVHVGSLVAQDWGKMLIGFTIFVGLLLSSFQMSFNKTTKERLADGTWMDIKVGEATQTVPRAFEETTIGLLLNPTTLVKGEPAQGTFANIEAYTSARKAELGSSQDPTPGENATIGGEDGQWYKWDLTKDQKDYFIEDFVVSGEQETKLTRTYRSRTQKPEEKPAAGGGN